MKIPWFGRKRRVRWEARVSRCESLRRGGLPLPPPPGWFVWYLRAEVASALILG